MPLSFATKSRCELKYTGGPKADAVLHRHRRRRRKTDHKLNNAALLQRFEGLRLAGKGTNRQPVRSAENGDRHRATNLAA